MSDVVSKDAGQDLLALAPLLGAIGDSSRWAILSALSDGQPRMVVELANLLDRSQDSVSKHLKVLKNAGVVVTGQAGMYRIPARFFPEPGKPLLDFGFLTLRLDVKAPA